MKLYSIYQKSFYLINKNLSRLVSKILSIVLFGNIKPLKRYNLDHPKEVKSNILKDKDYKLEYTRIINNILGWKYSLNSLKSFCYYKRFSEFIDVQNLSNKNFLEIGSGLCNFAMILTCQLEEYTYFCLDLPEMIPNGFQSIKENARNSNEINLFLPNQLNEGLKSKSKKKFIFILPSQLSKLNMPIDGFINHESFSEMNISVVNGYLEQLKNLCKKILLFF